MYTAQQQTLLKECATLFTYFGEGELAETKVIDHINIWRLINGHVANNYIFAAELINDYYLPNE